MSCLALPARHEVHVWSVSLGKTLGSVGATLSEGERQRAARIRADAPRQRFVLTRSALRALLARYLDAPPPSIAFVQGPHGKPALAESAESDLRFNLSHSGDQALLAFTCGHDVGVDIERVSGARDATAIASRFFATQEAEALRAIPEAARPAAFFRCWVRKEACLKALGEGIGHGLARIAVGVDERPAGFRRIGSVALADLEVAPGYVAAVATTGDCERIVMGQMPDPAAR